MAFDINTSTLMQTIFAIKSYGKTSEAKIFLNIASKYIQNIETLDEIAYLQNEIKEYDDSISTLKKTLAITTVPEMQYAIRANLAKMYNHLNLPSLSIGYSKVNYLLNINDYDTRMEISFSYYLLGNYAESEKMMREIASEDNTPDHIRGRVLYNLGSYDLEAGNFKEGIRKFIGVGHKIGIWSHQERRMIPQWDGSISTGKTVLIHSEGGIGDEIINVRFMKNIKDLGMNPIWLTNRKDLVEVFNRNGFNAVLSLDSVDLSNAVQCMSMYLPILLDLDSSELWSGKYLTASDEYISKWNKILPVGKKLAIKYSGNPAYEQDLHRSLPLDLVKKIKYSGTKINIQLEYDIDGMFNCSDKINNIEDTLAILWLCDDLVSSCTSVAHMNGALGKNGIICPPIASYYVWLGCIGKSNWYDNNLTIIRQVSHNNWDNVYNKIEDKLNGN